MFKDDFQAINRNSNEFPTEDTIKNEERFFENISENLQEFAEYKLLQKFYIVWILDDYKKWEEEVGIKKFILALYERKENNSNPLCVPYYTVRRFFAKTKDMEDYVEIPRRIYRLIKEWQTTDLNHYFYINKRYRNRKMDEFIDEIPIEEENPENIIIDQEQQARLERFVGNKLTKVQKEIFYKLVFENKKQSTIARELGITRQAVNESVNYIKKKFKKFYKLPWQILKKLLIKWKEEYPFI